MENNHLNIKKVRTRNSHLDFIIKILNKSVDFFESKKLKINKNPIFIYDSLAPILIEKEKARIYLDAINQALENDNIKNIGVTGNYGSGKSSLIETFKKEYPNYKYLNISLATFKETEGENEKEELERLLELSILQQIFYQVKSKEIPDSRFKRINKLSNFTIFKRSVFFIIWFLSLAVLFKLSFLNFLKYDFLVNPYLNYFSLCIFLLGLYFISTKAIRVLNNSKLNKLNIQSGEIELDSLTDQSILNKHLDEILYFFEITGYNVVILEDIDRFKNTEIFRKLREINLLINNSNKIKKNVTFIYAVRDELFIEGDRTKFFDFIVPVIPFITQYNASELLLKKIKKIDSVTKPTQEFINEVSSFIDDMRLLVNIINEYIIYKDNLSDSLDQNKLLAMIIYKNMHPDDFSLLHKSKGVVAGILNRKTEFLKILTAQNDTDIIRLEGEINEILNEKLNDIRELRSVYLQATNKRISNFKSITLNGKKNSLIDLIEDDLFNELIEVTKLNYDYYSFHSNEHSKILVGNENISFQEIEKSVNPNITYKYRENLILKKFDREVVFLTDKLNSIKKQRNNLYSLDLKEIIDKIKINDFIEDGTILEKKLILYLIREGYINENYHDYISYFHEESITQTDNEFAQSVKSGISLGFEYDLKNVINLINKIDERFFKRENILNIVLLNVLFSNKNRYSEKLANIIELLCDGSQNSLEFIDKYIEIGDNVPAFINYICTKWYSFWNIIELNYDKQPIKKVDYLKLVLINADITDIQQLSINSNLSNYISNKEDFLSLSMDKTTGLKIKEVIKSLNIKFENLLHPSEQELMLFDLIYEGNHYSINNHMLTLILKEKSIKFSENKFNISNYTLINASDCNYLIKYVDDNINGYLNNIFFSKESNNSESEESIISLLNNPNISDGDRDKIIEKQDTKLIEIQKIEDSTLLKNLFKQSKVIATWENVIVYYEYAEEKFDEILTDFLNLEINYNNLSGELLEINDQESDFVDKFTKDLLLNNSLTDESYFKLSLCTTYVWEDLNFESLSIKKINWLVIHKLIELNDSNFKKLKINFPNEHINLIEINKNEFMDQIDEFDLDDDDILGLLKPEFLSNKEKLVIIIKYIDTDLLKGNIEITSIVSQVVISESYDKLDLSEAFALISNNSSLQDKIIIFNLYFNFISKKIDNVELFLSEFPRTYRNLLIKRKRTTLKNSNYNYQLVQHLKDKNLISSFEVIKGEIKVVAKY